jgi:hypothetical protein
MPATMPSTANPVVTVGESVMLSRGKSPVRINHMPSKSNPRFLPAKLFVSAIPHPPFFGVIGYPADQLPDPARPDLCADFVTTEFCARGAAAKLSGGSITWFRLSGMGKVGQQFGKNVARK